MKKLIVILFVLSSFFGFAQSDSLNFKLYNKGKNLIGLQFQIGYNFEYLITACNVRYGRFLIDKLNAGIEAGYYIRSHNNYIIKGSPFIRYYFLKEKFSPFIETNYSLRCYKNNFVVSGKPTEYTNSVSFLGGAAYTNQRHLFGVELLLGYSLEFIQSSGGSLSFEKYYKKNELLIELRFNYHF